MKKPDRSSFSRDKVFPRNYVLYFKLSQENFFPNLVKVTLTLSWWSSLSCRNLSIDFWSRSMDWFLYYWDLRHERINHVNLNPFSSNVPLLYPQKTSENQRFSNVLRGYRSGTLVENGLIRVMFSNIRPKRYDQVLTYI